MPWTWLWAPPRVPVSWALSWSMLASALLASAQALDSMTAEVEETHAGLLELSVSMAMVETPAALTVPMPSASAQRGMRSNMVVGSPFLFAPPRSVVRRCSSPLVGRCARCFG
jgi:hypothetical protein